jgi:hypothetical protein
VAGLRAASGLSRDGAVINIGTLAALNTAGPFIAVVDVSKKRIAGVCKRHKIAPPVLPPKQPSRGVRSLLKTLLDFRRKTSMLDR